MQYTTGRSHEQASGDPSGFWAQGQQLATTPDAHSAMRVDPGHDPYASYEEDEEAENRSIAAPNPAESYVSKDELNVSDQAIDSVCWDELSQLAVTISADC